MRHVHPSRTPGVPPRRAQNWPLLAPGVGGDQGHLPRVFLVAVISQNCSMADKHFDSETSISYSPSECGSQNADRFALRSVGRAGGQKDDDVICCKCLDVAGFVAICWERFCRNGERREPPTGEASRRGQGFFFYY